MYSLFLLLFMMAETKKVEIQQPQVPVQQVEQKFDRYSMGYTDRPINQRKQVNNIYLDSCIYDAQKSIDASDVSYLTDSASYDNTGNYNFEWTSANKWFKIPMDWTYTITYFTFAWWTSNPTTWYVRTNIYTATYWDIENSIPREMCDGGGNNWAFTAKFTKWQDIWFWAHNNTDETLTIRIVATVTKISR